MLNPLRIVRNNISEVPLGQLAELVEEARHHDLGENVGSTDFEELRLTVRDLAIEAQYLVKRLESEFNESSDPDAINACLANHFNQIGREMGRIKELRGDPLVW